MSEAITPTRRPDYHYHVGSKVHPGWYNDNIDTYNVMVNGKFYLCVQIPFGTMSDEAEAKVMARAKTICPGIRRIPPERITIEFVSSIPPRDGISPKKRKIVDSDISDVGLQRAREHIKHIKHRDIIVEDYRPKGFVKVEADPQPEETQVTADIFAIRLMDGGFEERETKDFCYQYMANTNIFQACLDHNIALLDNHCCNIKSYHMIARRYLFPIDRKQDVIDLNLQHTLEKGLSKHTVDNMLKEEAETYAQRRERLYQKRAERQRQKSDETQL